MFWRGSEFDTASGNGSYPRSISRTSPIQKALPLGARQVPPSTTVRPLPVDTAARAGHDFRPPCLPPLGRNPPRPLQRSQTPARSNMYCDFTADFASWNATSYGFTRRISVNPKLLIARAAAPMFKGFRGATSTTRRLPAHLLFQVSVTLQAFFVETSTGGQILHTRSAARVLPVPRLCETRPAESEHCTGRSSSTSRTVSPCTTVSSTVSPCSSRLTCTAFVSPNRLCRSPKISW